MTDYSLPLRVGTSVAAERCEVAVVVPVLKQEQQFAEHLWKVRSIRGCSIVARLSLNNLTTVALQGASNH